MSQSSQRVLNVALIGCGEVAQLIHLPTLLLCSHMFKTVALNDISPKALKHCSEKYHVPKTFLTVDEMLDQCAEIDIVMVLSSSEYHAQHAIQCLQAGKHVFIEKPMVITHDEAQALEEARKKAGKVVFVGYMRRYATALARAKEVVKGMKTINHVRLRDIIGSNALFTVQSGFFAQKFDDYPAEALKERQTLANQQFKLCLGEKAHNALDQSVWGRLGGLASHDLSVMRELIGMPSECLCATRSNDGRWITATFKYPGFVAHYETGQDSVKRFDAHITVYGDGKEVTVNYDTPFIKGLPITAEIQSTAPNGDYTKEIIRPTYEDAYTLEYKDLYDCVLNKRQPKVSVEDSMEDLKLFDMIMKAMRE